MRQHLRYGQGPACSAILTATQAPAVNRLQSKSAFGRIGGPILDVVGLVQLEYRSSDTVHRTHEA